MRNILTYLLGEGLHLMSLIIIHLYCCIIIAEPFAFIMFIYRTISLIINQVLVKYINQETEQEFLWSKEKFFNRLYVMKEIYQNYEDGDENWNPSSVST